MRILAVVPAYFPSQVYGGPLVSTHALMTALVRRGHDVLVLTTNADGPGRRLDVSTAAEVTVPGGVRVRYARCYGRRVVSPTLLGHLPAAVAWADLVHLTAAYDFTVLPALALAKLYDKPVVWSPRGGLMRWRDAAHRVPKALYERACRAAAPNRCFLHVTSEDEAAESRARMRQMPLEIVPNGVELPPLDDAPAREPGAELRLLFIGRLHPIKGLENLLEAMALLRREGDVPVTLAVAGRGEPSYEAALRARVAELEISGAVRWLGQVHGDEKRRVFQACDVVVVPSFAENFGMVVVEALAHARPVIASRGTPWSALEREGAGLWSEHAPGSLAAAIRTMARSEHAEQGLRGRAWMERDFGWDGIAARMEALFERARA